MKVKVRQSVFETNSSATHTLSIWNKEDWEKFKLGENLIDEYDGEFYTEDEIRERYEQSVDKENRDGYEFDDWRRDECIYTYDEYYGRYEILTQEIEEVSKIAVSIYGWD